MLASFTQLESPQPVVLLILRCEIVPPRAATTVNAPVLVPQSYAYSSVPTWSSQHESLQSCVRYIVTPGRHGSRNVAEGGESGAASAGTEAGASPEASRVAGLPPLTPQAARTTTSTARMAPSVLEDPQHERTNPQGEQHDE